MNYALELVEKIDRDLDAAANMLVTADILLMEQSQCLLEQVSPCLQHLHTMLDGMESAVAEQLPSRLQTIQKKLRRIRALNDSAASLVEDHLRSAGLSQQGYTAAGQVSVAKRTGMLAVEA